jgi:hypothetical protein
MALGLGDRGALVSDMAEHGCSVDEGAPEHQPVL